MTIRDLSSFSSFSRRQAGPAAGGKRMLLLLAAVLFLLALPAGSRAAEKKKLTLLVYMCGSNLESLNGSASADIQEMVEAKVSRDVSVLVLAGGSKSWALGLDPEKTTILEIGARGQRTVETWEKMNLGDPGTLEKFLNFGEEYAPAEKYALILWDHGGGPLEGVCRDEQYGMDALTLEELSSGPLKFYDRFSWIGFDACLMSSVEVAATLAPYADYMIASQETEPFQGWNYSFLSGIENDPDGAATGRRIADAYLEGREDSFDTLTMACVDLSRIARLQEAMDSFFSALRGDLSEDTFPAYAAARRDLTAFGKAYTETADDGYDLVDLRGMIAAFGTEENGGPELLRLLDEAVVYSRSNKEGPTGLSLYFPWQNKQKYAAGWKNEAGSLHFSQVCSRYLQDFGNLLTGKELIRWHDLYTESSGTTESGESVFTLPLTEEQRTHFASGRLLILMPENDDDWEPGDEMLLAASCRAEQDENGNLTAVWDGKALYAIGEDGSPIGPVAFTLDDSGQVNSVYVVYEKEGSSWWDSDWIRTYYLIDAESRENPVKVQSIRVYDEATGSYTNRLSFSEDLYSSLRIWNLDKKYPGNSPDGILPAFSRWDRELNSGIITAWVLDLPNRWHFEYRPAAGAGRQFYALFEITDIQQNAYCSLPVPVGNPDLKKIPLPDPVQETESFRFELSGLLNTSEDLPGLQFSLEITNHTEAPAEFTVQSLMLNGSRYAGVYDSDDVPAGETGKCLFSVSPEELVYLSSLESVTVHLSVEPESDDSSEAKDLSLSFPVDSLSLGSVASSPVPLAETEQDGLVCRLLSLSPDLNGFEYALYVENRRDQTVRFLDCTVNDYQSQYGAYDWEDRFLEPGTSALYSTSFDNALTLNSSSFRMNGSDDTDYPLLSDHLLQREGFPDVRSVSLFLEGESESETPETLSMTLSEPWPIRDGQTSCEFLPGCALPHWEEEDRAPVSVLAENSVFTVSLERAYAAGNGLCLVLRTENHSDRIQDLTFENVSVNGQKPELSFLDDQIRLLPGSVLVHDFFLKLQDSGFFAEDSAVECFSLSFVSEFTRTLMPADAALKIPAVPGMQEGVMLTPEDWTVQPASLTEGTRPDTYGQDFDPQILVPDNSAQYRRWIPMNLTAEQAAEVDPDKSLLFLFRKGTDPWWVFLGRADVRINEAGIPGADVPGLFACAWDGRDEEVPLITLLSMDEEHLWAQAINPIVLTNNIPLRFDPGDRYCSALPIRLDYPAGTAVFGEPEIEGDPYFFQQDYFSAEIYYVQYDPRLNADGSLPPFDDFVLRSDIWEGEDIRLDGQPLKLKFRPITAEDDLYVFFSVTGKDGTSYCLPPVPYAEYLVQ